VDEHARPPGSPPLNVAGVEVHPPTTEAQARRLADHGVLADTPDGLLRVWQLTTETWEATVQAARALSDDQLHERVNGEWAFVETLRHLVMVTDAWVRRLVLAVDQPFHPIGIAPHFIPDPAAMGLDPDARPAFDEVVEVRRDRVAQVEAAIASLESAELLECAVHPWTRLGAFQVVIGEEWAHHSFATRDLAVLAR
jgi:uncharacterized damage-inducible protein DinB